jgi:hypothetical protein
MLTSLNFKAVKYPLTIQKEEINHRLKTIKTEIILSSIFLCNFFHISLNFKVHDDLDVIP